MVRPGMSDARAFTSYLPNCQLNMNIKQQLQTPSETSYRMKLQKDGTLPPQPKKILGFNLSSGK